MSFAKIAHTVSPQSQDMSRYFCLALLSFMTFSVHAQNLLNRNNPGPPVGTLGSPSFGQSLATAGGFGGGGAAGNRRIELDGRLGF